MKWKLPGERSVFRLPLNLLYYRKWTAPGFEKGLAYINEHPELRCEDSLLSRTGGKEVWKMPRQRGVENASAAGGGRRDRSL